MLKKVCVDSSNRENISTPGSDRGWACAEVEEIVAVAGVVLGGEVLWVEAAGELLALLQAANASIVTAPAAAAARRPGFRTRPMPARIIIGLRPFADDPFQGQILVRADGSFIGANPQGDPALSVTCRAVSASPGRGNAASMLTWQVGDEFWSSYR